MSMTFTKLFSSITESTIWVEPYATRIVWVSMLAMADRKGRIWASIPGLAKTAGVQLHECEAALRRFMEPDEYSRTKDHDGRRIAEIDGGWQLLNYEKYRNIRDEESRREYQREWDRNNRKKSESDKSDKSIGNPTKAEAEAEAEAEKPPGKSAAPGVQHIPADPNRVAALRSVLQADGRVTLDAKTAMHLRQWASEGVTDQQLSDAIAIARDRKPHPEIIPPGYLAPIVVEVRSGAAHRSTPPSREETIAEAKRLIAERERRDLLRLSGAPNAAN